MKTAIAQDFASMLDVPIDQDIWNNKAGLPDQEAADAIYDAIDEALLERDGETCG